MPKSFKREFLAVTFVIYLGVVAAITILPIHFSRLPGPHADHINLIPFRYSFRCVRYVYRPRTNLKTFCLLNTFGNIALFLPFGILLPLGSKRFRSLKRVMLVALGLSLSIEATQFVLRFVGSPRAVDIDDVLLNTFGACLGFAIYRYTVRAPDPKSKVQSPESVT